MAETAKTVPEIAALIATGMTVESAAAQGISADDLILAIRYTAEQKNLEAQNALPMPAAQSSADWATRKAWLLDGQAIHGELKTFYFPALAALRADDQAAYSRQRDLLFKAVRTFLGDPPPETPAAPIESAVPTSASAPIGSPNSAVKS